MSSLSLMILFFKQKTAYEMRISDWSSDVCSSDLTGVGRKLRGDLRPRMTSWNSLDSGIEASTITNWHGLVRTLRACAEVKQRGDHIPGITSPLLLKPPPRPTGWPPNISFHRDHPVYPRPPSFWFSAGLFSD